MTKDQKIVLNKWPDAEIYISPMHGGAFAIGSKRLGATVSAECWTREEAWRDAACNAKKTESEQVLSERIGAFE